MPIIKKISIFNGENWDLPVDIGVDAKNVDLGTSIDSEGQVKYNTIGGSKDLFTGLSKILPADQLIQNKVLISDVNGIITTSEIGSQVFETALSGASTANPGFQSQINNKVNKSGDTMTGNLNISGSNTTEKQVNVSNSLCYVRLVANVNGRAGLYDVAKGDHTADWIIFRDNSNYTTMNGVNYSLQGKNKVLAAPSNADGKPTFRNLIAADLPTVTVAKGGTGAATASPNRIFAGPGSGTAAAAPSFRALVAADIPNLNTSKLTAGTLSIARGGTGKTYGYTWQSLGSCTGTGNKTFNLTNYSEVLIAAKFGGKLVTTVIPKGLLTTSEQEIWISGGKSANNTSPQSGAMRAVCKITTTKLTGVDSNNGATNTTSSTTWYIYAR